MWFESQRQARNRKNITKIFRNKSKGEPTASSSNTPLEGKSTWRKLRCLELPIPCLKLRNCCKLFQTRPSVCPTKSRVFKWPDLSENSWEEQLRGNEDWFSYQDTKRNRRRNEQKEGNCESCWSSKNARETWRVPWKENGTRNWVTWDWEDERNVRIGKSTR